MHPIISMLEEILDTGAKIRIAKLLSEEKEGVSVTDISRRSGISKSRASIVLSKLERAGVLQKRIAGRSVLYRIADNELARMVTKPFKQERELLSSIEKDSVRLLKKLNPVSIVRYGSSLSGIRIGSDIDILVILKSHVNDDEIYKISADLTERYGIHISILSLSSESFISKSKKGEDFVINIIASHKHLYGKGLEDITWQGK